MRDNPYRNHAGYSSGWARHLSSGNFTDFRKIPPQFQSTHNILWNRNHQRGHITHTILRLDRLRSLPVGTLGLRPNLSR